MLSNLFWCAVCYGFDACFCVRYFLCLNGKELFQWFDGKLQIWNGTADATHWNCVPVRVVNYLLPFYCHYHWVLTLSSAQNTKVEIHVHLFQFWNNFLEKLIIIYNNWLFFLDTNGRGRASKKWKVRERGRWLFFFTTEVCGGKYWRRRGLLPANYPLIFHHVR